MQNQMPKASSRLITYFAHRASRNSSGAGGASSPMQNFDAQPPRVNRSQLPQNALDAADQLDQSLFSLNYYVRCFEADVQLYEFSAGHSAAASATLQKDPSDGDADAILEILDGWPVVAGRDGAMSIYHFGRIIAGIDETLAKAPILARSVDATLRRAARKSFQSAFPDFVDARDAVAHSGNRGRTI
jgi:hypothetical protein